jgi:hypothetical protein
MKSTPKWANGSSDRVECDGDGIAIKSAENMNENRMVFLIAGVKRLIKGLVKINEREITTD